MAECLKQSLLKLRGPQWKAIADKDDDEFYYFPVIKQAVRIILEDMRRIQDTDDYAVVVSCVI